MRGLEILQEYGIIPHVPTVSLFFGVVIRMYFDDHPPPHFHAYYGEHAAAIDIATLQVRAGMLPRRALALVLEWAQEHRNELMQNWRLAEAHAELMRIQPLE